MLTNTDIADNLRLTAKLMELTDENPFKVRAYDKAAAAVEGVQEPIAVQVSEGQRPEIEGVGKGIWAAIDQLLTTGTYDKLSELRAQVPEGVVELSQVPGLGVKKLQQIWRELKITTIDELIDACEQGLLTRLKGFGEKTQSALYNSLLYFGANKHRMLLPQAEEISKRIISIIEPLLSEQGEQIAATGDFKCCMPVVDRLEWVISTQRQGTLLASLKEAGLIIRPIENGNDRYSIALTGEREGVLYFTSPTDFYIALVKTSSSPEHWALLEGQLNSPVRSEVEVYEANKLRYLPAEVRYSTDSIDAVREGAFPSELLEMRHVLGAIHNHSTWSDGVHSLREMAEECQRMGLQYLCISDHSQTAVYAGGLPPKRVAEQQKEIDALNTEFSPFHVFKGIESDILRDGSLDYTEDILKTFDFVIGSIHSGFNMTEAEATHRLITAIENPYCTIVGHPTGRLLLRRNGYAIDHKKVIDAAAANGAAIELNCNPWRLDLDWTWLRYAVERSVMIALSPDAHAQQELHYLEYGVKLGRKGWLAPENVLNCLGPAQLKNYFQKRRGN